MSFQDFKFQNMISSPNTHRFRLSARAEDGNDTASLLTIF